MRAANANFNAGAADGQHPSIPEVSVAVASHERPVRLRWLLNALEEQTLDAGSFEVIVCHDARGPETETLLQTHPLAATGRLRHLHRAPGTGTASIQRNLAWRAARAPLVAFTDDDCRPAREWLERLVAAARRHPEAVLQGTIEPDPAEAGLLVMANHVRTQRMDSPSPWAQGGNVAYPRALLERLGGFDECLSSCGEDVDLVRRAAELGAPRVGVPGARMRHGVEVLCLPRVLGLTWRSRQLPRVVRRHPDLRRHLTLGFFWRPSHAWLTGALVLMSTLGLRDGQRSGARAGRRGWLAALVLTPWLSEVMPARGPTLRGRVRALCELPGRALIDAAELAVLASGSMRERSLLL